MLESRMYDTDSRMRSQCKNWGRNKPGQEQDLWKAEHDVAHDARLDELEKAGLEAIKKLVLEIDEQITTKSQEDHEYLEALKYQMDKGLNLDIKLTSLESTDVFLQEANRQITGRTANVEIDAERIEEKLNLLINQQQEMIDDKLKAQIADLLKDIEEINQAQGIKNK